MKKLSLVMLVLALSALFVIAAHARFASVRTFNEVQIFRGDPPGRSYRVLGQLDLAVPEGVTREQAIALLKKQAFEEHHADAVINVMVGKKRTGGIPRRTVCPQTSSDCFETGGATFSKEHATGTAVKWK